MTKNVCTVTRACVIKQICEDLVCEGDSLGSLKSKITKWLPNSRWATTQVRFYSVGHLAGDAIRLSKTLNKL